MRKGEWYFYRIERSDGIGPYYRDVYNEPENAWEHWMLGYHGKQGDNVHPGLAYEVDYSEITECLLDNDVKFFQCKFGFISLRQLQRWFAPIEIKKLMKLGYRIRRVLGRSVVDAPTQSLFIPVEM